MKQSKFTLGKILTTLCLCLLLMSLTENSAFATNTWIGGIGYWNVPTNWLNGFRMSFKIIRQKVNYTAAY